ncbi:hypothetical protein Fmac_031118 [Flemingia macrophylla]|uniref:Uncharacterized protein n=1 Tax=Flemingia macrophylla TaxID=520843 RepID=A0ABD1L163_9FABA
MRHQYLGVKQKIRLSPHHFNWKDGPNHWENFLKYKEVFGDVQLHESPKPSSHKLGFDIDSDDDDYDEEEEEEEEDNDNGDGDEEEEEEVSKVRRVGSVVELREAVVKREERRREREFRREKGEAERERKRREAEFRRERRREWSEDREEVVEWEERQLRWARRELEKRVRLERELEAERRWRKRLEEEEMEWRQRMVAMQVEHEKQMMQMHVEACQNQMQVLGIMARLLCQFLGSGTDGLGAGLGALPPQVLHHAAGLATSFSGPIQSDTSLNGKSGVILSTRRGEARNENDG